MNIAKALLADIIIGSNHGITINTNDCSRPANFKPYGTGVSMNYINIVLTLFKWKNEGWEVHPINLNSEFKGWI